MSPPDPPNEIELPADLAHWWREFGGATPTVEERSWPGGLCRVFRVRTSEGSVFLKQHPEHRSFSQERRAYEEWSCAFERTPRLLSHDRDLRLLVLSGVDGVPLCDAGPSPGDRCEWHRDAGRQLARLHALPYADDDPLPLCEALPRRVAVWCQRGRSVIEAPDDEGVTAFVADRAQLFAGESRVPCHLDYDERNWLVPGAGTGSMSIIDFEHSRADHWLADLVRLETGVWTEPDGPALREAFLDGYGCSLTDVDHQRLEGLVAVWCLATVVWARERGQAEFEALGRRGLERVLGA